MHYVLFILPNLLLAIDCAIHKRETTWFFILGFLGPLGAVVYCINFWEEITFPLAPARLWRRLTLGHNQKKCPHCGHWVNELHPFVDGRQHRHICSICRDLLAAAQV